VEKEDITLNATRNTLIIKVETKERKYLKELELPAEIDPKSAKPTYKNGVLGCS
jgi:HSP20 family protein